MNGLTEAEAHSTSWDTAEDNMRRKFDNNIAYLTDLWDEDAKKIRARLP